MAPGSSLDPQTGFIRLKLVAEEATIRQCTEALESSARSVFDTLGLHRDSVHRYDVRKVFSCDIGPRYGMFPFGAGVGSEDRGREFGFLSLTFPDSL